MVHFFVRLHDSRLVPVEAEPGASVSWLKSHIEGTHGIPHHAMRLVHGGRSLDNDASIGDTVECSDDVVSVFLRVRGGIDFQNRVGSKFGSGGVMSETQANADRRERLRKLAMETIDLSKDPYFMKNHLGKFECKLCLTLHNTEGNYLAHTQGKRHQNNLARRAAREAQMGLSAKPQTPAAALQSKNTIKIGRPGYRVTKGRDPETNQRSLLFEIDYAEAEEGVQPRHRFMSAYEQKVEAPDKRYQYLLFACEPYETIAFKIPNEPVDKGEGKFFSNWDADGKKFTLKLYFAEKQAAPPTMGAAGAPKRQVRAIHAGVLA